MSSTVYTITPSTTTEPRPGFVTSAEIPTSSEASRWQRAAAIGGEVFRIVRSQTMQAINLGRPVLAAVVNPRHETKRESMLTSNLKAAMDNRLSRLTAFGN